MSRLFTEFYFKEQVEYPDHIPTSNTEISNYASDIKKLSSAIDISTYDEDEAIVDQLTDLSKEADNIYDNVDGIIGGEYYCNYSRELNEQLETLVSKWQINPVAEMNNILRDIGAKVVGTVKREAGRGRRENIWTVG